MPIYLHLQWPGAALPVLQPGPLLQTARQTDTPAVSVTCPVVLRVTSRPGCAPTRRRRQGVSGYTALRDAEVGGRERSSSRLIQLNSLNVLQLCTYLQI
ncbi:hypothetical protein GN956_G13619 [Arapaima gigas]